MGYFVVRSAGSGTPIDLVAIGQMGHVRLIQVTRNVTSKHKRELIELAKCLSGSGVNIELWVMQNRKLKVIHVHELIEKAKKGKATVLACEVSEGGLEQTD
jgi:hypothetical protein